MKSFASSIWVFLFCFFAACDKMPYIPDENAVIYVNASSAAINLGETALISIHGQKGNGYPLPDGTIVYLSASRGALPAEAVLQDGEATVEFQADEIFIGDVAIKARSGQSQVIPESLIITIVDHVVDELYIWAEPTLLPYEGGQSRIEVLALDALQNPVPGKVVFISTSAGTLSGGGARTTDANGKILATLDTKQAAIVTAKHKDLECTVSIQVGSPNVMPVAAFSVLPANPSSGETVNFNASASYDSDGLIVSYQWDFGDGATASGMTASHVFTVTSSRSFVVMLKVTDNAGGIDVESRNIPVSL